MYRSTSTDEYFHFTTGQNGPNKTQPVLLLQNEGRWTSSQTRLPTDEISTDGISREEKGQETLKLQYLMRQTDIENRDGLERIRFLIWRDYLTWLV